MPTIDSKRNELIEFIKSQMTGPGGCGDRFGLSNMQPNAEVLNTSPGSIYSTAILFPEKMDDNSQSASSSATNEDGDGNIAPEIGEQQNDNTDTDDLNTTNKDGEESFSLARRFPNAIAISCCVDGNVNLNYDLQIRIKGRYYSKIEGHEKQNVFVKLDTKQVEDTQKLLNDSNMGLASYFSLNGCELHHLLCSANSEDANKAKQESDQKLARQYKTTISQKNWGVDIFKHVQDQYLYLYTVRNNLYKTLTSQIENLQPADITEIENLINEVGRWEQVLDNMSELISLYYKTKYGFWISHEIDELVNLANIDFSSNRRIYCPTQISNKDLKLNLTNDLSLSVLLQITSDHRNPNNKNKYLKIQLQNSSTKFIETVKDHFTLVNEKLNSLCFFDIKIEVECDSLLPYRVGESYQHPEKEEDKLKYLYRNVKDYAIGNLCSVDWEKTEQPNKVWTEFLPIYNLPGVEPNPRNKRGEWVEEYNEVEKNNEIVPPRFLENQQCLNFNWLSTFSDASDDDIIKGLNAFVDKYGEWIDILKKLPESQDDAFADDTISHCMKDYTRMKENVAMILKDMPNMLSFRLMNAAMLMQIWHNDKNHSVVIQHTKTNGKKIEPDFYNDKGRDYYWRPFQLAFILLNLDGIVKRADDPQWNERNEKVDMVWFPTGGGKTEAYLGIIAFTIINRRKLYGSQGYGTTAIMRYTLRMLAQDQFRRALKLILALDQIRIWGTNDTNSIYHIGNSPVSIGLYAGQGSLPNLYEKPNRNAASDHTKYLCDAADLWKRRNYLNVQKTNIPLDKCPWCGEPLDWGVISQYRIEGKAHKEFYCTNPNCTFHRHLPTQLCDELVYADPPTLLFGTVDKFAQLARKVIGRTMPPRIDAAKKDSRRLFGVGLSYRKPELIIQDELHLLLGPLGSAVALFEAAIDQLCTNHEQDKDGNTISVRPKIISSTATTRNTSIQIRALYDRDVNIFPKSGVDYDDSFFSFYSRERHTDGVEEWKSQRRYLGIMPTGRTQMIMQIRLAAILFVHRALYEKKYWQPGVNDSEYNKVADNYHSIVSYFNSLKEVGKTDAQYPYEFTKYVQRLYRRVIGYAGMLDCYYADENTLHSAELSGRLNGAQIVSEKDRVTRKFDVAERSKHKIGLLPPDYILATNMISVGIDIDRFNTIVMNSMPRNIAEYIQASSRVARSHKGLVITLHNPFASRDVSHFEKFIEFHKKMYFYVEPISITPYSPQSLDKYLPLYIGTMIRHTIAGYENIGDANTINSTAVAAIKANLERYFLERLKRSLGITNPDKDLENQLKRLFTREMKDMVMDYIDRALNEWENMAQALATNEILLFYDNHNRYANGQRYLYVDADEYDSVKAGSHWKIPQSLRIVEQEAVINVKNEY